jgi:hypothetical protein
MEFDIIVDGFCQSMKTHNLIYNNLIEDGDSSGIKKLRINKPYGNYVVVQTI